MRLYEWNSGTDSWDQLGSDIDGEAGDDQSGYSVSLSSDGSIVAIGANGNDGTGTPLQAIHAFISGIAAPAILGFKSAAISMEKRQK